MSMLCTCIRGQMSNTFLQSGGKCPPLSITWGQMSLYTIFHRGADVRGGKCPTLLVAVVLHEYTFCVSLPNILYKANLSPKVSSFCTYSCMTSAHT